MSPRLLAAAISLLAASASAAQPPPPVLDLNYYYDTRDFRVFTLNAFSPLPRGFEYFSFVNYFSSVGTTPSDADSYFTEQHLRWRPPWDLPIDAAGQWVSASGKRNEILRLGARWRVSQTPGAGALFKALGMVYTLTPYPLQADFNPNYNYQLEHFWRMQLLPGTFPDRAYLFGFADHNLGRGKPLWVTETQLGVRLVDRFFAVAEFRHNGFMPRRRDGWGFGLEYEIRR